MDFSHFKKLEVKGKTAKFIIYQISGEPTLILKPATEANKPYFNSVLKRSRKRVHAVQAGSINANLLTENRNEDRELYPKHIICGWENVTDSGGATVVFNEENCTQFVDALPDWIFDDIRNFASKSQNFTGETIDIEDKSKN